MSFWQFSKRYAFPLWGWYAAGIITLAGVNFVALEIPQLAKDLVNVMVAKGDLTGSEDTALAIVGLGLLMLVIRATSRILIFWPGRNIETKLKSDLFSRLMRAPQTFYERFGMGDLISRVANDVNLIRVFYAFGLLQVANMIFLMAFTIGKMITVHQALTAACLVPLTLMLVIARIAMPRMHKYSKLNQEALGRLTSRVTEAFVNIHVIQTNAAEDGFWSKASKENEAVYDSNMKLVAVRTFLFPMMIMLAGLAQLVVLFYGGYEVMEGRLTAGDILAFNAYIGLLVFPLTAMGMLLSVFQRARTALDRTEVIAKAEQETALRQNGSASLAAPLVEVKNLMFQYPGAGPGDPCTLNGIDFRLEKGRRIGIYGPIGCGKSTLFSVMTRLYDPPPKTVFLKSRDVLTMEPEAVRREMGFAMQAVHMFSATIRENLAFGLGREASQAELDEAARLAWILDEILAFDKGWDTEIGEKGVRLSGGQKQRLALARLFLRKPPVLLLDDVMSAVDHRTEQRLLESIYGQGFTMVISSHRASVLKRCDEILLLEKGMVVDRGIFAELKERHPDFAEET